jgi:pimeloyl-ACP methyl ester carboxylesterase
MKKVFLLLFLTLLLFFHVGWYAISQKIITKNLPDEQAVTDFQYKLKKSTNKNTDSIVIEEKYLQMDKIRLHMDILAHGMGSPTVVFIPGTAVYAQIYAEFLFSMYNSGFNVIGFDPRGHGRSSGLRGDYTINEIVDDTVAVVGYAEKRFGGKTAVIGSSQGGIAAFYTAARGGSVSAVVCHNIADLNGKDNLVLSQFKIPDFLSSLSQKLMTVYKNFAIPVSLYLDLEIEKLKNGSSVSAFIHSDPLCVSWITIRAMNSLLKTDLAKPIEEITVPLMLIHSDKDTIFPQKYVEEIFNRLNCEKEYLLIKNTNHLVMTNNVSEVEPTVTKWLKNVMGY